MFFDENIGMADQLITIARHADGKIFSYTDSNNVSKAKKLKYALKYLFTGKKHHNTMCNLAFPIIADLIGGLAATAFNYVAIGTGTTNSAATDSALQTESKRKVCTPTLFTTTLTNDTLQFDVIFGQSGDGMSSTLAVTEVGVLNAATSGTLLVHFASTTVMATFTPNTSGTGDTFEAIVRIKNEQGS
jgi:hypothetical protein